MCFPFSQQNFTVKICLSQKAENTTLFLKIRRETQKNSTDIFTPELSSTKVQIYLLALGEDLALH